MTDAIGRRIGLGRTEPDRALLRQALLDLDTSDGLAAKMTAKAMLGDVMAEFVGRLIRAYGSLTAIRDQVILDIACGSNSSRSPVTGRRTVAFEPWMCRLLAALGARPVGLDIGDLDRERFEHHHVDLGVPGALDFLPSASFDAIHESRLFGSPEFRSVHGAAYDRVRAEITRQEARLLRREGILIHSDAYDRAQSGIVGARPAGAHSDSVRRDGNVSPVALSASSHHVGSRLTPQGWADRPRGQLGALEAARHVRRVVVSPPWRR